MGISFAFSSNTLGFGIFFEVLDWPTFALFNIGLNKHISCLWTSSPSTKFWILYGFCIGQASYISFGIYWTLCIDCSLTLEDDPFLYLWWFFLLNIFVKPSFSILQLGLLLFWGFTSSMFFSLFLFIWSPYHFGLFFLGVFFFHPSFLLGFSCFLWQPREP